MFCSQNLGVYVDFFMTSAFIAGLKFIIMSLFSTKSTWTELAESKPNETQLSGIIYRNVSSPGHLHGVLGEIDDPVDQVESAERQREEDAGVFVDDAGAGQNVVGRDGGALLQEGLGVDGRVGKRFGGAVKERRRVHPLLQHAAGVHLGERKGEEMQKRCEKRAT